MSTLSVGQMNQFADAAEAHGWKADHFRQLGQDGDTLKKILSVLAGQAKIVMKSFLSFVATVKVVATKGKKTADCFADRKRYYDPDPDIIRWLPADQPAQEASEFSVQQFIVPGTFKQAVESFLGVTGEISVLAKTLRERGCVTTLPVIESLVERQEAAEDVDLDGWANFFFVEEKKEENQQEPEPGVSVVFVRRAGRQWGVNVRRLDDVSVWKDGFRFFFRNKTL